MKPLHNHIKDIRETQNNLEIQLAEIQIQQELTNCKLELAEMTTSETQ